VRDVPHNLGQEVTKRTRDDTSMNLAWRINAPIETLWPCRLNGGKSLQFIDVD
jgi:hypothetical protein